MCTVIFLGPQKEKKSSAATFLAVLFDFGQPHACCRRKDPEPPQTPPPLSLFRERHLLLLLLLLHHLLPGSLFSCA